MWNICTSSIKRGEGLHVFLVKIRMAKMLNNSRVVHVLHFRLPYSDLIFDVSNCELNMAR